MEYGLPQDYYNKKFDPKLQRERRYRGYGHDGYILGNPMIPVGVVVAGVSLPDPQIFFTEPKIKKVDSIVKKTENLTINITGDPEKIKEISGLLKQYLV
jgi:hypothetical protein